MANSSSQVYSFGLLLANDKVFPADSMAFDAAFVVALAALAAFFTVDLAEEVAVIFRCDCARKGEAKCDDVMERKVRASVGPLGEPVSPICRDVQSFVFKCCP